MSAYSIRVENYEKIFSVEAQPNISYNVHVLKQHLNDWKKIKAEHAGNYYMTTLLRTVLRLAVGDLKSTNKYNEVRIGDFNLVYRLPDNRKDIYIQLITLVETLPTPQNPGTYKTKWESEEGVWKIKKETRPSAGMELSHQWLGYHMAAVPGRFEKKEQAARQMGLHIENAYISNNTHVARNNQNTFLYFGLMASLTIRGMCSL